MKIAMKHTFGKVEKYLKKRLLVSLKSLFVISKSFYFSKSA